MHHPVNQTPALPATRLFLLLLIASCASLMAYSQSPALVDSSAVPVVVGPGTVSTPNTEWATSFTPDGQTIYFSEGAVYWTIVCARRQNSEWQTPQVASFSGRWRDTDPFVSPDGKRLFFISNRPQPGAPQDKAQPASHLWYVTQTASQEWGTPQYLDTTINLPGIGNYGPSVSGKGALYFCSRDRGGKNGMQSYYCTWEGDHFAAPQPIHIEGVSEVQDPFIAPDESYLVFVSGNDLYVSVRGQQGWEKAQKLGPQVNNGDSNSSPYVSADGQTLYYSSSRIVGFYKRDVKGPALNYAQLVKENNSLFNSQPNILMVPFHAPKKTV